MKFFEKTAKTASCVACRSGEMRRKAASESGNVLFLILIAVALFAALSYAVTQSSRSSPGGTDDETGLISSAQVTQYPASVRTSIMRMVINGTSVESLLFNAPSTFATMTGAGESTSNAVFHPDGGSATFMAAPPEVMESGAQTDWIFSAAYQIEYIGTTDSTDESANDIIAFLPGVKKSICKRMNEQLGITTTAGTDDDGDGVGDGPTDVPAAAVNMDHDYKGFPSGGPGATKTITDDFSGQPYGCYDSVPGTVGASDYVYYHVLFER